MKKTLNFFTYIFVSMFFASSVLADPLIDAGLFVVDRDAGSAARKVGVEGVRPTISAVVKGGEAEKAGLKTADIILAVGGKNISRTSELREMAKISLEMLVLRGLERINIGGTAVISNPLAIISAKKIENKADAAGDYRQSASNDALIVSNTAKPRILSLDECLKIALEKNRDIQKAREYANMVQGRYLEERAAALPQISLDAGFGYSKDNSMKALFGTANLQSTSVAELSMSQVVFTWGKLSAAIRAAEVGLKTADQQLRIYRQGAYRDVSIAFYDILLAKELHRLAAENLAQKLRHQNEAGRKFIAGVATDYDTLAADVEVENAVPEVIKMANSIKTGREKLRFLLGIDQQNIDIDGAIDATPEKQSGFDETLVTAIEKRPELADQKLRIGIYKEIVTIAEAENKPRLDFKGSAGWRQLELSNPGPNVRSDGPAWNVGLYLTFPFFDGLRASGKAQQARSELKTSEIEEARMKDSIALELRTAHYSLAESAEIIKALSGTVRQAKRLLEMSEKGFEYGVKTRLDVDDAQTNLIRSQYNHIRAMRDYLAAQVNLKWAMGVLGE